MVFHNLFINLYTDHKRETITNKSILLPMASGKYLSILAFAGLLSSAAFAQKNDAGYGWVLDSSKRSVKNMPQQNEFINNQYPYPSKPRSMWELGLSGGNVMIIGDKPVMTTGNWGGIGGGLSVRKALSHTFSVRGGWAGAFASLPRYPDRPNPWSYWTKTSTHMLTLDLIASLNTISPYRGNPKVNFYGLAGYSLVTTLVQIKSGPNKGTLYPADNKDQNSLITSFGKNDGQSLLHGISYGAGIAFRVTDRINVGVEERITSPLAGYDYLDGVKDGTSGDKYAFSMAKINFNLGNSSKQVLPLWWLNPNNYIYNEVNEPKHMKMPPVVLPDADGDGVTDQFDMEPNTPSGAAVDSHGVSRDTDGDGVPDYKDKEPLTARDCFPVDADGVGKCPEPPCCTELRNSMIAKPAACAISSLPSVQFKTGSLSLSATSMAVLNSVAQQLNANPDCKVKLTGYYKGSDKRSMQLGWDRVNTVMKYLTEKQGISESRLIFSLSDGGDPNTVDLMGTTEEGPNSIPAPFPNLQKSK